MEKGQKTASTNTRPRMLYSGGRRREKVLGCDSKMAKTIISGTYVAKEGESILMIDFVLLLEIYGWGRAI